MATPDTASTAPLSRLILLAWISGLLVSSCASRSPTAVEPAAQTGRTPMPAITSSPLPPSATPHATASAQPAATPFPSPTHPPASPTQLGCWHEGGRIETHRLFAEFSPSPWDLRVYAPPCYDQESERRYPTLYLIHGSTFTDDQWDRLGADETADRLIAAGALPPFLIVMPRDRISREPDNDPFREAMIERIIPWIDEYYRTLPAPRYRAIGGLSRGASWAVHLGLTHWQLFGAIGAHSLPVFRSDTAKIRGWLREIPPESLPRIYMDIGEKDYQIESAIWFENILNEMDIPHEWRLNPGKHEEEYWTEHLEEYLRWYAAEW